MGRLRELASAPAADGAPSAEGQQEFRGLLARVKLLRAVVLPLREESALLERYAADVEAWNRALDRDTGQALRGLAIEFVGIAIALGAILVGSILWRIAVVRYVTNGYHRRLLLTARHVVVVIAIALILVFHFARELTALVAALGFAAAGIAFALQNVILAVAGYFSMVAPNGIRVGDRVSLQGPYGYVHGEVIEIGVVRTRLQELVGEPLQQTGRIIVVPNSVAFTGSFIKHAPPDPSRSQTVA
jgi:small-conductance mechanosensitive channel